MQHTPEGIRIDTRTLRATRAADISLTLPAIFTPDEKARAAVALAVSADNLRATDDKGRPVKLTPSEVKILVLITRGLASAEVADVLYISKRTVDFHLANVFDKLGTTNRAAAMAHARALGLVP